MLKMGERTDNILTIKKSDGRRKCPKCNEENKSMIHELEDKTNIINAYPRIYGKKYRCGQCSTIWREE